MKSLKLLIMINCFYIPQIMVSSSDVKKDWKVVFFAEYMDGYQKLSSPGHKEVADVLNDSFNKALDLVQEEDQAQDQEFDLVEAVRSQVTYFVTLSDEKDKTREMEKCNQGMKKASSWYARVTPAAVKAQYFVQAFYNESQKRILSQKE